MVLLIAEKFILENIDFRELHQKLNQKCLKIIEK